MAVISKITTPDGVTYDIKDSVSGYTTNTGTVIGTGNSGYLAKWNSTTGITNGPQLGSSTTTFLRNDGTWATPDTGSGGGVQSDWNETDTTSMAYILNKPNVYTISSSHDGNGTVTLIASVLTNADNISY